MEKTGRVTIKRSVCVCVPKIQEFASRVIEQMIDLGDAEMEPLGSNDMYTHKLTTVLGDTYFVYAKEVCGSDGSHHCSSGEVITASKEERAYSLLRNALDWLGLVNITEVEEGIVRQIQFDICNLLEEC